MPSNICKRVWRNKDKLAAQVKLAGAAYTAETNRADIHFDVKAGPTIHVQVKGAHLWSWTRKSLLPVYQGVGVDPELVQEGREALVSYFQGKGFFDVDVDSQFHRQDSVDTIVYVITKGKKHKVTGVSVAGNSQLKTPDLMALVTVKKSHLFSPGNYSEKLVRSSVKNLTALYQSEGFSNAQVTSSVSNKDGNLTVAFHVVEGPRDIVSSLKIEGADTFPEVKVRARRSEARGRQALLAKIGRVGPCQHRCSLSAGRLSHLQLP